MSSMKHVHTYARSKRNKRIYRCVHPDCSHYSDRELLKGKRALCKCGTQFIIESTIGNKHLKRATLQCDNCLGLGAKPVLPSGVMDQIFLPPQLPSTVLELEPELEVESEFVLEEDD